MISDGEMERRWSAVRDVMVRERFDWIVASTGHPFGYSRWLTDRTGLGGPLAAIGLEGDVIFASHGDEIHSPPRDSHGVRHVVSSSQLNMMANTHAPLLANAMRSQRPRRIGMVGTGFIPTATYLYLRDAFADAAFVDVTDVVARIKARKSPEELALMRAAAAMHDQAVELAWETVRPGITAGEVVSAVRAFVIRHGSTTQTLMGGSAARGDICRYAGPAERVINPGDVVTLLIECSEPNGYYSEAMPTFCLGEIPDDLQRAFDDVVDIQRRLLDAVRPGMLPAELLTLNDRLMNERGYPGERRLLGHSQGLDLVERPAFSPLGENLTIEHDMVISVHPTVHARTAWGYPNNMSFHFDRTGLTPMLRTPQRIFQL